jgi:enamine deaminase RidA (YjgF/YER057c/UK114 family)
MSRQYLNLDGAKPPGYTHVVATPPGRLVFVSGRGDTASTDFALQCEATFEDLGRCLALAGATFKDVVKINYYVTDLANLAALREIRSRYLDMDSPPASTLVQAGLIPPLLVEIECVAVVHE